MVVVGAIHTTPGSKNILMSCGVTCPPRSSQTYTLHFNVVVVNVCVVEHRNIVSGSLVACHLLATQGTMYLHFLIRSGPRFQCIASVRSPYTSCSYIAMVLNRSKPVSKVQFTPFLRGVIWGLFVAGYTYLEISDEVEKSDGCSPCVQSIADCIKKAKALGGMSWDGDPCSQTPSSAGRPRSSTPALDKAIVKLVFKMRGRAIVTTKYIKKMIKAARAVSSRTLSRRLGEAGLAWLRRRRKTVVPHAHKLPRLEWAAWVLTRTSVTLARWAYTDGTTFFLARSQTELESKARLALGAFVYRMANGSDGLYEDCVGPSSYAKAQGTPVRIWGMLVAGILFIYVLPTGKGMNRTLYTEVRVPHLAAQGP